MIIVHETVLPYSLEAEPMIWLLAKSKFLKNLLTAFILVTNNKKTISHEGQIRGMGLADTNHYV